MRRSTISLIISTLLLALPVTLLAQEQRIAAIVNDDVVSAQDLSERLGLVLLTSRIQDQEQARRQLSPQVLRSLIHRASVSSCRFTISTSTYLGARSPRTG